jgi:biotin carboxyl carrier protein
MKYLVTVNGKKYDVEVEEVASAKLTQETAKVSESPKMEAPKVPVNVEPGQGEPVKAPMPGTILDVRVSPGQAIKKGDVLFILEAMKMENEIMSGKDGTITSVSVSKGDSVNTGDLLAVMK